MAKSTARHLLRRRCQLLQSCWVAGRLPPRRAPAGLRAFTDLAGAPWQPADAAGCGSSCCGLLDRSSGSAPLLQLCIRCVCLLHGLRPPVAVASGSDPLLPLPLRLARRTMVSKTIGGAKNGGKREVPAVKAPKFYPADDVPTKTPSARETASKGIAKLRKSITPGTVLILLGGRFRGRRCVFLKQLASGLLLVSGPYAVNGVPLRRVNQSYVIATSTKVAIGAVDGKIDDSYFGKAKVSKSQKKKKKEEDFFAEGAAAPEISAARKADQAKVDGSIKCDDMMKKYLKARFSLSKHEKPHAMLF